jgi:hypothetical protein
MHCVSWKLVAGRMPGNSVCEPPNGAFLLFLPVDWGLTHTLCDSPASFRTFWTLKLNWSFLIFLSESHLQRHAKSTSLIVSLWVGEWIFIDFYWLAKVSSHQNGRAEIDNSWATRRLAELVQGRIYRTTLYLILFDYIYVGANPTLIPLNLSFTSIHWKPIIKGSWEAMNCETDIDEGWYMT